MSDFYDKINVSNKSNLLKIRSLTLCFTKLLCRKSSNSNELYSKSVFGNQLAEIDTGCSPFFPSFLPFVFFLRQCNILFVYEIAEGKGHIFFPKEILLMAFLDLPILLFHSQYLWGRKRSGKQ